MFISTKQRRAGWILALLLVAAVGALVLVREQQFAAADQAVVRTLAVQRSIADTLSALKDAETGQRGFLLTGNEAFLAPYSKATGVIPEQLQELQQAVSSNPEQARHAAEVRRLANEKLNELALTIAMFKAGRKDESLARVGEGRGRRLMVAMREQTQRMLAREAAALDEQKAISAVQRRHLQYTLYASAFALVGIAVAGLWSASRGVAEAHAVNLRLRRTEQAFRSLADNASDLVRVVDERGRLIYVSPSCAAILGFSQEEMRAMPARALLHEAERETAHELSCAVVAGTSSDEPFVHQLLCKDGWYRWFETKYCLTPGEPDASRRIQLTSRDITARRAAEHALRRQTRRLESVLSSMGDGVVVVDERKAMLYVNPVASQYMRQEPGQLISSDWVERHQACELDGTTPFAPDSGPLTQALGGKLVDGLGLVLHDKQGVARAFSVTARPIQDGSVIAGCVAVYRDITEQRLAKQELEESEQRQRVLSEASFEGIVISRDSIVLDVNATFASWFGRDPESFVGEHGSSLLVPEDRERALPMSHESGALYESQMQRPDGSRFSVEVRGRDATFRGLPVRIAVIRDITERKRQEAELRLQAELLRALSLKDELTGLYNRRGFVEHAQQQLRGASRAQRSACVFFVDLDDMKGINDTLGHEFGDRALTSASRVLRSVFRDADIVSRLGGDEFAVFASDCEASDVATLRERLRSRTNELNDSKSEPFHLSMSVGAAAFEPGSKADLDTLMELADQNMYREKRAARGLGSDRPPLVQPESTSLPSANAVLARSAARQQSRT
ncbi:MAG TPA: diguanylate cyclase [Polyangiaceae bacterium]|nr:diguanylate cyclase [Polyangiaceae bacterium]